MQPNFNLYTILLVIQGVLIALTQLAGIPADVQTYIAIALIVVNALLAGLFQTPAGRKLAVRMFGK